MRVLITHDTDLHFLVFIANLTNTKPEFKASLEFCKYALLQLAHIAHITHKKDISPVDC